MFKPLVVVLVQVEACLLLGSNLRHAVNTRLWETVRGFVKQDNGETHRQAAWRELYEETGIGAADVDELIHVGAYQPDGNLIDVAGDAVHVFLARVRPGTTGKPDEQEFSELALFPQHDIGIGTRVVDAYTIVARAMALDAGLLDAEQPCHGDIAGDP